MRITKKLVTEVVSQEVGIDAVDMALFLKGKHDVSEVVIAEDMKISVQEARAILYKLYEKNLATFERKRDKHKGWHISHWDFLDQNITKIYRNSQKQEIVSLKRRIDREQQNKFYMCKFACTRSEFDNAIELNFKCPECGNLMNPQDNKRTIEVLNGKLKKLSELVH